MSSRAWFAAMGLSLALGCSKEPAQPAMPPPPTSKAPASAAPVAPAAPASPAATPAAAAPAGGADPAVTSEAAQLFRSRCSTCHGVSGLADGPLAAALNPKPRSFGDQEWQKSVTDEHIEKVIRDGGPAVGKSPIMPANPDLKDKPAVITALRTLVRSMGNAQ